MKSSYYINTYVKVYESNGKGKWMKNAVQNIVSAYDLYWLSSYSFSEKVFEKWLKALWKISGPQRKPIRKCWFHQLQFIPHTRLN